MNIFTKLGLLGFKYFLDNFIYKVFYKAGLVSSKTVFLSLSIEDIKLDPVLLQNGLKLAKLEPRHLNSLREILIFDDVLGEGFFNNQHKGGFVVLAEDNRVVAFSFYDSGSAHSVNGWANIKLKPDTAWVGPVFVHPKYRGKRLNKALYFAIFSHMSEFKSYFITCINSNNSASINSHQGMGFKKIGEIIRSKGRKPQVVSNDPNFKYITNIL